MTSIRCSMITILSVSDGNMQLEMCDNQKLSFIKILITHHDKDDTVLGRLCCCVYFHP